MRAGLIFCAKRFSVGARPFAIDGRVVGKYLRVSGVRSAERDLCVESVRGLRGEQVWDYQERSGDS